MKTLVPPPITPGQWQIWGANMGPIPLMWRKDGEFDYVPGFTLWQGENIAKRGTEVQAEILANYTALAALPECLAALESCLAYLRAQNKCDCPHPENEIVAALLSAGYTEAADPLP